MSKHYIGLSGLRGYMPQYTTGACDDLNDAIESLATVHEFGRTKKAELKKYGYTDLNLQKHGSEYAEVQTCDCDTPEIHNDY